MVAQDVTVSAFFTTQTQGFGRWVRMQERRYLLHVGALGSPSGGGAYYHRALELLDSERRRKAMRQKEGMPRAASVGAGLLLQLAIQRQSKPLEKKESAITLVCLEELLDLLQEPVELSYRYGENGKPYLKGEALYFNLSHSGEYVLCALSGEEIGADIQKHQVSPKEALVKRFFSEQEQELFANCKTSTESEELFYRLWTRKEAYAKLTGQGLAAIVSRDVYGPEELHWEEYIEPEGYHICVCRYKEKWRAQ